VLTAVKGLTSDELLSTVISALQTIDGDLSQLLQDGAGPTEIMADLIANGSLKRAAFSVLGTGFLGGAVLRLFSCSFRSSFWCFVCL
jgi:hypothetical protein